MAQPWKNNAPLISFEGNVGTIDGDGAAAMRYTGLHFTPIAIDAMFTDWDKTTMDWKLNYSEDYLEPEYITCKYPLLWFNGTSGMGYGMACNIPCYNISEVCDAFINQIKHPNSNPVLIPDYPTGCLIEDTDWDTICKTGEGKVTMMAKWEYDEKNRELIITNIPYGTSLNTIKVQATTSIKGLKNNNMFSNFRDDSDRKKIKGSDMTEYIVPRLVFKLKRGVKPETAMEFLYKVSDLRKTDPICLRLTYGYDNVLYSMKSAILDWVDHRREEVERAILGRYKTLKKNEMMLSAILTVVTHEAKVNKLSKDAEDKTDLKNKLIKEFGLNPIHAETIAEFKQHQRSKSAIRKYKADYEKTLEEIKKIEKVIHDESLIDDLIIKELKDCKQKYGTKRLSQIIPPANRQLVADIDYRIILTKDGFIKKLSTDTYDSGVGVLSQGDKIIDDIEINNREILLVFDSNGVSNSIKVNDLPEAVLDDIGISVTNYASKAGRVVGMMKRPSEDSKNSIIFLTEQGQMVKIDECELSKNRTSLIAIKFKNKKDKLVSMVSIKKNCDLIIYTNNGDCLRMNSKALTTTGRGTIGVIGVKLPDEEDKVVGMIPVQKKDKKEFLILLTNKGNAKKIKLDNLETSKRGGKLIRLITLEQKETLVSSKMVDKKDEFVVILNDSSMVYKASDVKEATKIAKGKKLVPIKRNQHIVGIVG